MDREKGRIRQQIEQHEHIKAETRDIRIKIEKLEKELAELRTKKEEYMVVDSVSCGKRGKKPLRTVKVTGFPFAYYKRKEELLKKRKKALERMELRLLESTSETEELLESMSDSRKRRIITYRVIDSFTWQQIANRLGGRTTADAVRKEYNRFWEEAEKEAKQ